MARLLRPLAVTGAERPGLFDRVRGAALVPSPNGSISTVPISCRSPSE